jgi:hypothetical protein
MCRYRHCLVVFRIFLPLLFLLAGMISAERNRSSKREKKNEQQSVMQQQSTIFTALMKEFFLSVEN